MLAASRAFLRAPALAHVLKASAPLSGAVAHRARAYATTGKDPLTTPLPAKETKPLETAASADSTAPSDLPLPTEPTQAIQPSSSLAEQYLELSDLPAAKSETFPGNTTSARSRSASSKSSIEKRRQAMTKTLLIASSVFAVAFGIFISREWDSEEEGMRLIGRSDDLEAVKLESQGGLKARYGRGRLRVFDAIDYLNKPAWEPLIPPPLPEPHGRPYTLVVDLDDLLVHSSWDSKNGWRTAKRPGVDYFLAYLSQFYEIVLFTTQPAYTAMPIVEKLDPYGAYIPWKLYRESTRYKNKALCKDLSYMGRPLEKTVMLDTNPEHVQLQPGNSILLTPWTGSRNDATAKELVALIPFLEALAIKGAPDVRTVIKYYEGKHIPTAYAEAEHRAKMVARDEWEAGRASREGKQAWLGALFGSLGGAKSRKADEPPEIFIEQARKHAQNNYIAEQKYWKDNEAAIKQQMDEDRERQLKEMKGSLLGFMGIAPPAKQ